MPENKDRVEEINAEKTESKSNRKSKPLNVFLIVTASLVIVLSLASLAANVYLFNRQLSHSNRNFNFSSIDIERPRLRDGGGMMRHLGGFVANDTDIIAGVVTSVSDNSFVVAGHGKQYTVKTNSDTDYNTTDKKVSINDSVVVYGDLSDTTITATDINILND